MSRRRSRKRGERDGSDERRDRTRSKTTDGESGTRGTGGRVERLHRAAGNQAVQRAVEGDDGGQSSGIPMGPPDSSYEREADAVASSVGADGSSGPKPSRLSASQVQRATEAGGGAGGSRAPPSVEETVSSSGQPLDREVRTSMESKLGADFGSVRVHTGPQAARSASEIGARAYTVGNDVAFNRGEYAPDTTDGREVLAHELTHVAQQGGQEMAVQRMGARPRPNPEMSRGEEGKEEGKPAGDSDATADMTEEEVDQAMVYADLAQDVYDDSGAPDGWIRGPTYDGEAVGIPGFYAALYRKKDQNTEEEQSTGEYVLAYRGTDETVDWTMANVPNALDFSTGQYRYAVEVAQAVDSLVEDFTIVGHSLGGGLASAGSMVTGAEAITFNAAGPSTTTMMWLIGMERGLEDLLFEDHDDQITAYFVRGDVVSSIQDSLLTSIPNPLSAVVDGDWELVASPAQGERKELPQPENMVEEYDAMELGKTAFGVNQHMMETVKKSLQEIKQGYE